MKLVPAWLRRTPGASTYVPAPGRRDWILWGALGCALVSTAHAEYTLATAAHFNEYVALAVPGALDLYVVRALQQRRDVFVAVLAMVAANVASHLIAGGVLRVEWPVIAAVGAVAPLIVWRVYSLKYARTRQELLWGLEAGTGPEDVPGTQVQYAGAVKAPEYVPEEWSAAEYGDPDAPVPYLRVVPAPQDDVLEAGYTVHSPECPDGCGCASALDYVPEDAGAVHLNLGDDEYLPVAYEYVANAVKPTVRGLKDYAKVGQARAERLLKYVKEES